MGKLTCQVDAQPDVTTVWLRGELDLATTSAVRTVLLKCLADCPTGLIVDLSRMTTDSDVPMTVFTTVARRAMQWPGIPLLLCAPTTSVADRLSRGAVARYLTVHPTREEALAALGSAVASSRTVRTPLTTGLECSGFARHVVAEACAAWGLGDLSGEAQLIASELATNAARHASPPVGLLAAIRGVFLHIVVRDGSPVPPPELSTLPGSDETSLADHGRGLHLINAFATSWGSMPTAGGKAVWATLRIHPRS